LLIRVIDAEAGQVGAELELRSKRDKAAVAQRNRALADAAYAILRRNPSRYLMVWDLIVALLARGAYRSDLAPDPLEGVLEADPRLLNIGFHSWMLAGSATAAQRAAIPERQRLETDLFELVPDAPTAPVEPVSPLSLRRGMEGMLADITALLGGQSFDSLGEANTFLQDAIAGGGPAPPRPHPPRD